MWTFFCSTPVRTAVNYVFQSINRLLKFLSTLETRKTHTHTHRHTHACFKRYQNYSKTFEFTAFLREKFGTVNAKNLKLSYVHAIKYFFTLSFYLFLDEKYFTFSNEFGLFSGVFAEKHFDENFTPWNSSNPRNFKYPDPLSKQNQTLGEKLFSPNFSLSDSKKKEPRE